MRDIISPDAAKNPKKFWSFIKGKKQESSGVAPLRQTDGTLHSNPHTKPDILNCQFKSVFTKEDMSSMTDKGDSPHNTMDPIIVTIPGVEKLLKNIKPYKATGPDSIPARLLNELSVQLAPVLTYIYQKSITAGEVPDDWKMAHVVPIFICSKLMEHILHSNIMSHFEKHTILTEAHHGFRSRRSCESQLIYTVHELTKGLSEGKQIDVILLDFSKAFDKVPHERLIHKLHYYGVRNNTLSWIRSFLQNRKQLVMVEGERSTVTDVDSGVPQGTVMGPLLFLAFINVSSPVRIFADDCLVYRSINKVEVTAALQNDMSALQQWESDWQMMSHPEKCTTIHISKKRNPIHTGYKLHGHTLESVPGSKYLGVHVNKDLSWNDHIQQTSAKASRSVGFLWRNLRGCPQDVKAQAYTTLV